MRVRRHRQVMDVRARRISTRSVARLLRHGRRWCGGAYRLGLRCLSLNVNVVTHDATHRYRAIDTLTAMTGIFVICAFALKGGQDHRAVGIEWLVVAAISIAVYVDGYVQVVRRGGSMVWLRGRRVVVAAVLYLTQLVGAALLVADRIAGLYVAAVAMVAALTFMISSTWLLVVGVTMREPKTLDRSP